MAVNDIWKVELLMRLFGQQVVNVLHFKEGALFGVLADQHTLVRNRVWGVIENGATSDLTLEAIKYSKPLVPTFDPVLLDAEGEGAEDPPAVPSQVAVVCSLRTGLGGRTKRGRLYAAAPPTSAMASGLFSAGYVAGRQSQWDDTVEFFNTDPASTNADKFIWCVFSRKNSTAQPITQILVRDIPGTIRKRRIGVGG